MPDLDTNAKSLWQLLWEYDPNGLVVYDEGLTIQVTNPAFAAIFGFADEDFVGKRLDAMFDQTIGFERIITCAENRIVLEQFYPTYSKYIRQVLFKVESEDLFACILVDQTERWEHTNKLHEIQEEAVRRLNELTNKQMKAAQEIASLLGETTAETKVNVLKLQHLLEVNQNDDELH